MHLHPSTELSGKPQGRLNSTLHLLYIGPSSCTQWRRMQARDGPTLNPWQAPQVDAWCWEQLFSNCVVHALLLLQPPLPLSLSTCCLSSWEDRLGRGRRRGIGIPPTPTSILPTHLPLSPNAFALWFLLTYTLCSFPSQMPHSAIQPLSSIRHFPLNTGHSHQHRHTVISHFKTKHNTALNLVSLLQPSLYFCASLWGEAPLMLPFPRPETLWNTVQPFASTIPLNQLFSRHWWSHDAKTMAKSQSSSYYRCSRPVSSSTSHTWLPGKTYAYAHTCTCSHRHIHPYQSISISITTTPLTPHPLSRPLSQLLLPHWQLLFTLPYFFLVSPPQDSGLGPHTTSLPLSTSNSQLGDLHHKILQTLNVEWLPHCGLQHFPLPWTPTLPILLPSWLSNTDIRIHMFKPAPSSLSQVTKGNSTPQETQAWTHAPLLAVSQAHIFNALANPVRSTQHLTALYHPSSLLALCLLWTLLLSILYTVRGTPSQNRIWGGGGAGDSDGTEGSGCARLL